MGDTGNRSRVIVAIVEQPEIIRIQSSGQIRIGVNTRRARTVLTGPKRHYEVIAANITIDGVYLRREIGRHKVALISGLGDPELGASAMSDVYDPVWRIGLMAGSIAAAHARVLAAVVVVAGVAVAVPVAAVGAVLAVGVGISACAAVAVGVDVEPFSCDSTAV